MSSTTDFDTGVRKAPASGPSPIRTRADALAERLEYGARALATLAAALTDAQWQARMPGDGRTLGVIVHHVASVYPVEIQLARTLAEGKAIGGVTMDDVHAMNADHAKAFRNVSHLEAIDLLRRNSTEAAAVVRSLSDAELDQAAPASLYGNAPVTCQFVLEDHAVRHSYHHLARISAIVQD